MKLTGERVRIRNFKLQDIDAFYDYGKNPKIGKNAGWKPFDSYQTAKNILFTNIYNNESFCICLKETNEFIGSISLYDNTFRVNIKARNLGFSLKEEAWGNGYAKEAAKLMLQYAFEKLKVDIVGCGHFVDNIRSEKIICALGFTYEGLFRKYKKLFDGTIVDAKWYSMTKTEYERIYVNETDENEI